VRNPQGGGTGDADLKLDEPQGWSGGYRRRERLRRVGTASRGSRVFVPWWKRDEPHGRQRDETGPRRGRVLTPSRWCETTRTGREGPPGRWVFRRDWRNGAARCREDGSGKGGQKLRRSTEGRSLDNPKRGRPGGESCRVRERPGGAGTEGAKVRRVWRTHEQSRGRGPVEGPRSCAARPHGRCGTLQSSGGGGEAACEPRPLPATSPTVADGRSSGARRCVPRRESVVGRTERVGFRPGARTPLRCEEVDIVARRCRTLETT